MILGVNSRSSNIAVHAELGRYPLHISVHIQIIKYYFHLLERQENPLLSKALRVSKRLNTSGTTSWFSTLSHLIKLRNITSDTIFTMNPIEVKNSIKIFLQNLYSANWEKDRKKIVNGKSSSKLELYAFVKPKLSFEKYLS